MGRNKEPSAMPYLGGSDICLVCSKRVYFSEKLSADDKVFHKTCFRCKHCSKVLSFGNYASLSGQYYCKPHFKTLFKLKGNYNEGFGQKKLTSQWAENQSGVKSSPAPSISSSAPLENTKLKVSTKSKPLSAARAVFEQQGNEEPQDAVRNRRATVIGSVGLSSAKAVFERSDDAEPATKSDDSKPVVNSGGISSARSVFERGSQEEPTPTGPTRASGSIRGNVRNARSVFEPNLSSVSPSKPEPAKETKEEPAPSGPTRAPRANTVRNARSVFEPNVSSVPSPSKPEPAKETKEEPAPSGPTRASGSIRGSVRNARSVFEPNLAEPVQSGPTRAKEMPVGASISQRASIFNQQSVTEEKTPRGRPQSMIIKSSGISSARAMFEQPSASDDTPQRSVSVQKKEGFSSARAMFERGPAKHPENRQFRSATTAEGAAPPSRSRRGTFRAQV